jgi:serine protease
MGAQKLLLSMINTKILYRTLRFVLFISINSQLYGQSLIQNDWAWQQVGIQADFKKLSGKKTITLAIIDDAFQIDNVVLKPYLKFNTKDFPENDIDDDHNGKTDDYIGWDVSDNDANVNPPKQALAKFGHGTKVAGIVLEGLNRVLVNAKDVIKIIPIKSSSDTRNNNYITDGYEAIKYAIEQKADIIICCWSGGIYDKEKEMILKNAKDAGILIIASGGNFITEKEQYPAAYPWAINTAALSKSLSKHAVSNSGRFIDLALPGDSIATISPLKNDLASFISGTSASAAMLGGIVAAVYAAFPALKAEECDRILKNACDPLEKYNPLFKGKLGAGILNINRLIKNLASTDSDANFYSPKGYIAVSKKSSNVFSAAKYPSFKLINPTTQTKKNVGLKLTKWINNIKIDTTFTLIDLHIPLFFKADSFQISSNKTLNSFIYFEAQAIDSSYLYCSETVHLTAKNGIITDGSGEENYANNSSCKWELEVAKDKKIKILFDEIDTEAKIDQIYIFSEYGTESPILAIFSGQNLPPQIITWTNKAMIWFVTNGSTNHKGWKLSYEEVE